MMSSCDSWLHFQSGTETSRLESSGTTDPLHMVVQFQASIICMQHQLAPTESVTFTELESFMMTGFASSDCAISGV